MLKHMRPFWATRPASRHTVGWQRQQWYIPRCRFYRKGLHGMSTLLAPEKRTISALELNLENAESL